MNFQKTWWNLVILALLAYFWIMLHLIKSNCCVPLLYTHTYPMLTTYFWMWHWLMLSYFIIMDASLVLENFIGRSRIPPKILWCLKSHSWWSSFAWSRTIRFLEILEVIYSTPFTLWLEKMKSYLVLSKNCSLDSENVKFLVCITPIKSSVGGHGLPIPILSVATPLSIILAKTLHWLM